MSDNFSTVLVEDSRLSGLTDKVKYAVVKGGANITQASFNAISATGSQIVFNCPVPSENIVIDRRVMFTSQVNLTLTIGATVNTSPGYITNAIITAAQPVFNYGNTDALQYFPLQSLMTVMTATINNTSVSVNIGDILPALALLNKSGDLYAYNGTTNTLPDGPYLNYSNGTASTNNVLSGINNTDFDSKYIPRGSLPITITNVATQAADGTAANFTGATIVPGIFIPVRVGQTWIVNLSYTVAEPLLFSPFLFGHPKWNNQGFYGIQNLNFQFNVNSTCNREFSTSLPYIQTVQLASSNPFQNTQLLFNFLTPQPSQLLKSRNVVPYYEIPRYISTLSGSSTSLGPSTYLPGNISSNGIVGISPSSTTMNSMSLQLNQIPDKLIIFVRNQLSSQNAQSSSSFLVIDNITMNFNNSSGLLSSCTQYQLYQTSRENGSQLTWEQFCGWANFASGVYFYPVPTTGSLLVLEFGKDIQLPDYYAPGSLGNFNLQFKLGITNQSTSYPAGSIATNAIVGSTVTPELVICTMNSGVMALDRGTANIYTGILTKEDVLNTSAQMPYTNSDVQRLVGGTLHDHIKSSIGHMLHKAHPHHHHHRDAGNLSEINGGAMGASVSGGKMHHKLHKHLKS